MDTLPLSVFLEINFPEWRKPTGGINIQAMAEGMAVSYWGARKILLSDSISADMALRLERRTGRVSFEKLRPYISNI